MVSVPTSNGRFRASARETSRLDFRSLFGFPHLEACTPRLRSAACSISIPSSHSDCRIEHAQQPQYCPSCGANFAQQSEPLCHYSHFFYGLLIPVTCRPPAMRCRTRPSSAGSWRITKERSEWSRCSLCWPALPGSGEGPAITPPPAFDQIGRQFRQAGVPVPEPQRN